jgi:hypothetical protein
MKTNLMSIYSSSLQIEPWNHLFLLGNVCLKNKKNNQSKIRKVGSITQNAQLVFRYYFRFE